MTTFRDELLNRPHEEDTARLWYNEDETRSEGKLMLKLTEEYLAQDTFQALLNDGWEPVRADAISVMEAFWCWIEEHHDDIPTRDDLRRDWFEFIKTREQ